MTERTPPGRASLAKVTINCTASRNTARIVEPGYQGFRSEQDCPYAGSHAMIGEFAPHSLAEVLHHVELVEQNDGRRDVAISGIAKRFPHVHDGESGAFGFLFAEESAELIHDGLAPIVPAEPDRPTTLQIADHDPIAVLADRDLIDSGGIGARRAHAADLFAHIVHLAALDRLPVQVQFGSHVPGRAAAAAPPHVQRKALGVQRFLDQNVQSLALHRATAPASDSTHLQGQVDPVIDAGQIPRPPAPVGVLRAMCRAADTTDRFFPAARE